MLYAKITLRGDNGKERQVDLEGVVSVMPTYRIGEGVEIRAVDKKASKRGRREVYAAHVFQVKEVLNIEISPFPYT